MSAGKHRRHTVMHRQRDHNRFAHIHMSTRAAKRLLVGQRKNENGETKSKTTWQSTNIRLWSHRLLVPLHTHTTAITPNHTYAPEHKYIRAVRAERKSERHITMRALSMKLIEQIHSGVAHTHASQRAKWYTGCNEYVLYC